MIQTLFSGMKLILDLVTKQDADRRGIADLLDKIADSLKLTIEPAQEGKKLSPENFSEFLLYCENFDTLVDSALSPKTRKALIKMLEACADDDLAYHQNMSFQEMSHLGNRISWRSGSDLHLDDAFKLVGQLKAYANMLRASRNAI